MCVGVVTVQVNACVYTSTISVSVCVGGWVRPSVRACVCKCAV